MTAHFSPDIGGVETLTANLLPALQRRGHQFMVIASPGDQPTPDVTDFNGIPVHRFRLARARSTQLLANVARIAELRRQFQPDIVHMSGSSKLAYTNKHNAPAATPSTLVTVHGRIFAPDAEVGPLQREAFESADWITGVSNFAIADLQRQIPDIRKKCSVIYNGVPLSSLTVAPPPAHPTLLCLGRLAREKAFDTAIAAFSKIQPQFANARLIIAGTGPELAALQAQASALGLQEKIHFAGAIKTADVGELIARSTLLLLPSRGEEGMGLVLLEAARAGRPVVATRVGGIPEVVVHGETGILVEPENPDALSDAVLSVLKKPDDAATMGLAAQRRIRTLFDLEHCADQYDRLYRALPRRRAR